MNRDRIELQGLRAFGRHGVLAFERENGQEFVVDVTVVTDTATAATSDALADTVDYGALAQTVVDRVGGEPVALIERLADELASLCLLTPGVDEVEIVVHKPQAPVPVPFSDVTVSITRRRRRTAVVALGANLGDRRAALQGALFGLHATPDIDVRAVSPVYETPAVGPPAPDYLNAVAVLDCALSPEDLLSAAQRIEAAFGRVRAERWGPRTLDIDLLVVGEVRMRSEQLTLPHPGAATRAFVLAPWVAVDAAAVLPGVGTVAAALAGLAETERTAVRRRDELRLHLPGVGMSGPA